MKKREILPRDYERRKEGKEGKGKEGTNAQVGRGQ